MQYVSLIIPTYNEARNIPFLIEEIFNVVDKTIINLEFIVVDDNSPDKTGNVVEGLAQQYPIKVLHRMHKTGLGSAVRDGFEKSGRPYIGVMDADLSHDPIILNSLIKSLVNYDIAIGSRFEVGSSVERWSWGRKLLSKTGVVLARLLTHVHDPLSGYFFLRREVLSGVSLTTCGYKILFEILVKGKYNKVTEIPYNFRMRRYSYSKLNYKEYISFLVQIGKYAWYKLVH